MTFPGQNENLLLSRRYVTDCRRGVYCPTRRNYDPTSATVSPHSDKCRSQWYYREPKNRSAK